MSDPRDPANWPDTTMFEAIYGLRATRIYRDERIPNDVMAKILTATTRACSSGNTQPWEFVLVTDEERKLELQAILREAYADVDARRAQTPEQLIDGAGRPVTGHAAIDNIPNLGAIVFVFWNPDRGIRMQGEYEENPDGTLKDLINFPGGRGSSVFQACQNMMLSAYALGVQSLFTTFFGLCEREVKALLHVPPRMFIEGAVFLGYGDEPLNPPKRRALRKVVHLNDWDGEYDPKSPTGEPQASEVPA